MSYLKQYLSKEDFDNVEEVTSPAPGEPEALAQEFDNRVNEIESLDNQRERAERVVEELETQQEAVRAIVEQNGGLTENEAALVESQRRTAAVALDVDPDSEVGQTIVDQPGLEAMVSRGVLSLEEGEKFVDKVKNTITKIIKAIREKIKSFFVWVSKFTNVLKHETKEAYDYLKSVSDEEFNKRVSWLPESALEGRGHLFKDGVFDYAKARIDLLEWREEVNKPFAFGLKGVFALVKTIIKTNSQTRKTDTKEERGRLVENSFKELRLKLKKLGMEGHKRTSFEMMGKKVITHDLYKDGNKGLDYFRYDVVSLEPTNAQRNQIKRKELLKAINQDFRNIELGDKEEAVLGVMEDMGAPVEGLQDLRSSDEYKREMSAVNLMYYSFIKVLFTLSSAAVRNYRDLIILVRQIKDVKEPKETLKLGYKG